MNEKTLMALGTVGGIIFFPTLLAWFMGGQNLQQGNNRTTLCTMVNFEILLFVVSLVINFIPVIGQIVALVLGVANIVISIKAFTCVDKEAFVLPLPTILK